MERPGCPRACAIRPARIAGFGSRGWRKGWDSNPRTVTRCWFSRPVHSTTLPPFHGAARAGGSAACRRRAVRTGHSRDAVQVMQPMRAAVVSPRHRDPTTRVLSCREHAAACVQTRDRTMRANRRSRCGSQHHTLYTRCFLVASGALPAFAQRAVSTGQVVSPDAAPATPPVVADPAELAFEQGRWEMRSANTVKSSPRIPRTA